MIRYIFLFFLVFSCPAFAQCLSTVEAEAEQGVKIHSELMVIGLNCQAIGMRNGLDLYGDYQRFTQKHSSLLSKYEAILMNFYKKSGEARPEQSLNFLRTKYANNVSDSVAKNRPDIFCAKYGKRILAMKNYEDIDVRRWAATQAQAANLSYPLCEKPVLVVDKP